MRYHAHGGWRKTARPASIHRKGKRMRIGCFLGTLLVWLCAGGAALAGELAVVRADSAAWPLVRVTVSVPEADGSAPEYILTLPSGATYTADSVTALPGGPTPAAAQEYGLEFDLSGSGLAPGEVTAQLSWQDGGGQVALLTLSVPPESAPPGPLLTGEPSAAQAAGRTSGPGSAGEGAGAPLPDAAGRAAAREKPMAPAGNPAAASARPVPESGHAAPAWPWALLAPGLLLPAWLVSRRKKIQREAVPQAENAPLVLEFPDMALRFPLLPGTMVMGPEPGSDIRLDSPETAGVRVEFRIDAECGLHKLDGSSAVRVNGEEVTRPVTLKPGDTLAFGSARAVIRRADQ